MKAIKSIFTALLISVLIPVFSQPIQDLKEKASRLAIEQNEEEIKKFKSELEAMSLDRRSSKDIAEINFLRAFCGFQLIGINYGQIDDMMNIFNTSRRYIDESLKAEPNLVKAIALKAMMKASSLPPNKTMEAIEEELKILDEKGGDTPFRDHVVGYAKMFSEKGSAEELERVVEAYENSGQDLTNNWWYWDANAVLADIYLGSFKQAPNYEMAASLTNKIKKEQPKMGYLRVIAPRLLSHSKKKLSKPPKAAWTVLAQDEQGDGADPVKAFGAPEGDYEIFDGKSLAYYLDFAQGMVWFKFEFHEFPSENFGINLMFEVDRNEENGGRWFSNRSFRYDYLGTLWVTKSGLGTNGLSTAFDADRRRMASKSQSVFEYFVDKEAKTVIVGIAHQDLGFPQQMKVASAVGSNLLWSDNMPDSGSVEIKP